MTDARPNPVLVVSHERSGTHLLIDALRRNFQACRAKPKLGANPHDWLYFSADRLREGHPRAVGTDVADQVLARAPRPILKAHMTPDWPGLRAETREWFLDTVRNTTILFLHRDGRDVLCSYHRLRLRANPSTPRDIAGFLRSEVEGRNVVDDWAAHTTAWLDHTEAHAVPFERLLRQPDQTLDALAQVLNLPRLDNPRPLPKRGTSPWPARWSRLTGRIESSNLVALGPVGQPQRWQHTFTEADRAFFHEHAGPVLQRLGYIDSHAWVTADSPAGVPSA